MELINLLFNVTSSVGINFNFFPLNLSKTYRVLFDRKEGDYFIGRTEFDSPDVDNEVLVKATDTTYVRIGDFSNVLVEKVDHFDLYGVVVN